jgi:LacI family transcriptional regulator
MSAVLAGAGPGQAPLPDCVFAVTDVMAIGALAAFRDHGVNVPGEVSLAGFDDIPIVGDLTPPLTTVALPLDEMGERAMGLVLREPRGNRSRVERIAGEVVLRASTAPPARITAPARAG